ncbi:GNAT family N-acetyltransferase [Pseudactinotalea sp.]|uniref:GNAT family N-acetyltransferase n=1 Tax=Pseudactinotalea sp. TaxID=1926260 RepID=UPI003B3A1E59
MSAIGYRSHRHGDAQALPELLRVASPQDAVDEDWFAENVLLDPAFTADGLQVAEIDGRPVGFVYATAAPAGSVTGGWITLGCVHPDHRRQGIGARLLERAVESLRTRGAAWAEVSGYPRAYFLPGVDAEAYPGAVALLRSQGFEQRYTAAAMSLDLSTYQLPADILSLAADRRASGYDVGAARYDDLPAVLELARTEFAPDWADAVREALIRHGHLTRLRVVRGPDGVCGFAIFGAYRGLRERFGPFGVAGSLRGTGLGKVLLHDTLTAMRAEGAHHAWFLWTGEDSPAGHLYRRTGFTVTRRFDVMRRDLIPTSSKENSP